jgi:hypothetical protein
MVSYNSSSYGDDGGDVDDDAPPARRATPTKVAPALEVATPVSPLLKGMGGQDARPTPMTQPVVSSAIAAKAKAGMQEGTYKSENGDVLLVRGAVIARCRADGTRPRTYHNTPLNMADLQGFVATSAVPAQVVSALDAHIRALT